MYRFLWRPAWVVSHVLVLALVVAMVNLGLWQLRRLDERRERNAQVEQNASQPPLDVATAIDLVDREGAATARYRPVLVRGRYDAEAEVAIRSRSFDGAPGRWVATPIVPADGGPAVLVVRGWMPAALDDVEPPLDGVEPPTGEVEVVGHLMATQERGSIGSIDPDEGTLAELSRVDVERFDRQYDGDVAPFWLQLATQEPPTAGPVTPVPLPAADEGPHLAYAVQWGIFTLIAVVGYPIILRRVARQKAREADADAAGDEPPVPEPVA